MKTSVFASDLDRTLIYSHRVLDQYEYEGDYDLVEMLDERPLSYMSVETKNPCRRFINWAGLFQ